MKLNIENSENWNFEFFEFSDVWFNLGEKDSVS